MEVRSEPGILSGGDSFSVSIQPPLPSPVAQNMRMAFSDEGTAAYRPVSGGEGAAAYRPVSGGEGTAAYRPVSGGEGMAAYRPISGGEGTAAYRPVSGGEGTAAYRPVSGGEGAATYRPLSGGEGAAAYRPVSGGSAPASYQGVGGELPAAQGFAVNPGQRVKRKRGRPKKYDTDGKVAIGLSSAPASSPAASGSTGFSLSYTSLAATTLPPESSSLQVEQMKKSRGRPPGSSKKHQMNDLGSGGIGFTPHVITVKAGEDVSAKIMSFSHHGPRAVCILSANGAISNVTLRQAATSGGTVTYEGRFEILSLSGSFLLSESAGQRSRTGGLSVSLAGPDGRVLGGGVAGLLTAASPVQVVVGSFIADGERKEQQQISPLDVSSAPIKLAPGGMPAPSSPPSRGYLSESSGGGPSSPFNQSTNGNNNQQSLSNMPWK